MVTDDHQYVCFGHDFGKYLINPMVYQHLLDGGALFIFTNLDQGMIYKLVKLSIVKKLIELASCELFKNLVYF